jgi:ATP-dependent DNA helicase HFM1/MER3
MKPNERPSLRELNKSPFMKFQIKENVSTTAHKISLIIQVQLGGIDLPATKEFNIIRRQFMMEKNIIFERVQRLIRCIVDCAAFNCDAVSMRHALDLARSLSAEYWENSNLQLRQIQGVGPVAARKLVTSNINSVELLANQDTSTIERIVGKNPPFGRKLLETVSGFPRLKLAAGLVGKPIIKAGQNPKINVRVVLGFSNVEIPIWHGSRPSLTFMAETTNVVRPQLVHFWRGNISKLDKGFELKFHVSLENPDVELKCTLACDEIVGTLRFCSLDPGVPSSAFPAPKLQRTKLDKAFATKDIEMKDADADVDVDEFGSDAIDEEELIAAVKKAEAPEDEIDNSDEFPDIDDLCAQKQSDQKKGPDPVPQSVQMENGKWSCQHRCRGDALLKSGKQCKHVCCREGLDKRPAPPRPARPKVSGTVSVLA